MAITHSPPQLLLRSSDLRLSLAFTHSRPTSFPFKSSSIPRASIMDAPSSTETIKTSSSPTENLGNAIVVGGGPAGCLMTHYLLQRGFHVHLFERRPTIQFNMLREEDGAGGFYMRGDERSYPILLTTRGVRALENVGLQLPPSLLKPLVGACVHLPKGKKVRLQYPDDPGMQSYGVSRNALVAFLQESLIQRKSQNLTMHFGWELSCINNSQTTAFFCPNTKYMTATEDQILDEGKRPVETMELGFDLLIGADGVSSNVRSELLRLDKYHQPSCEASNATPVMFEFLKNPDSYKSFYICPSLARASPLYADHDRVQSWPALKMLILNVADGSFWGGSKNTELINACSPSEVESIFRKNAPEVLDLLLQENPNFPADYFKQPSISFGGAVKLSRFHHGNILLVGDAAHSMFPSYGTGCNAALEDCLLFDKILEDVTPSGEGRIPFHIATTEFTKRRIADAHAIVDMNTNMMLFSRNFLGMLQIKLLTSLHKWFPRFFQPTAYQLLWSDVPFSTIQVKKHQEDAFFYGLLTFLSTVIILAICIALRSIMA